MAKGKKLEMAPKSCNECEHWEEIRNKLRVRGVLESVLKTMEEKLTAEDFKPSLGDFLKLIQMEKEIAEESPKEIKVTWVEPGTPEET